MPGLEQETTGCIYGITSDFEVAKIWVKSCGSVMTLEDQARGMNVVEAPNQDKLVPHASQLYNLTRAFKIPTMFFDSEETKRKISELEGRAASMRAAAQTEIDGLDAFLDGVLLPGRRRR
jgi:hypothetical protein